MRKEDLEILEGLVDQLELSWERCDDAMEGYILEKMEEFFDRIKAKRELRDLLDLTDSSL